MIQGVNCNLNSLQALRASQAFKKANNVNSTSSIQQDSNLSEIKDRVDISSFNINKKKEVISKVNINEFKPTEYINNIKDFASKNNISLTNEDLQYGIKYGQSVLVNQTA